MEGLRRTFGMGEPIRRGMERRIVERGGWRPALLGMGAGVHEDILGGRDCEVAWEDVYKGEFVDFLMWLLMGWEWAGRVIR